MTKHGLRLLREFSVVFKSLDPPPINPGNATTISYSTNDDLNDFHT